MHIDCNHEEAILIYPYFKSTLLSLIRNNSDFPWLQRHKILQHVAEAIEELHSRSWIHIGKLEYYCSERLINLCQQI